MIVLDASAAVDWHLQTSAGQKIEKRIYSRNKTLPDPHLVLLPRIWRLRHNFSAYDAAYIVLAETLGTAFVTRDARLVSASGHTAAIELF